MSKLTTLIEMTMTAEGWDVVQHNEWNKSPASVLAYEIIKSGWRPPLEPNTVDYSDYTDVIDPLAQFKKYAQRGPW